MTAPTEGDRSPDLTASPVAGVVVHTDRRMVVRERDCWVEVERLDRRDAPAVVAVETTRPRPWLTPPQVRALIDWLEPHAAPRSGASAAGGGDAPAAGADDLADRRARRGDAS